MQSVIRSLSWKGTARDLPPEAVPVIMLVLPRVGRLV